LPLKLSEYLDAVKAKKKAPKADPAALS
jgi:hypothetical protein